MTIRPRGLRVPFVCHLCTITRQLGRRLRSDPRRKFPRTAPRQISSPIVGDAPDGDRRTCADVDFTHTCKRELPTRGAVDVCELPPWRTVIGQPFASNNQTSDRIAKRRKRTSPRGVPIQRAGQAHPVRFRRGKPRAVRCVLGRSPTRAEDMRFVTSVCITSAVFAQSRTSAVLSTTAPSRKPLACSGHALLMHFGFARPRASVVIPMTPSRVPNRRGLSNFSDLTMHQDCSGDLDLSSFTCVPRRPAWSSRWFPFVT